MLTRMEWDTSCYEQRFFDYWFNIDLYRSGISRMRIYLGEPLLAAAKNLENLRIAEPRTRRAATIQAGPPLLGAIYLLIGRGL